MSDTSQTQAARYTLYLRNGKEVDFMSSSVKVTTKHDPNTGKHTVTKLEAFKKDKGMSLIFVDYSQISAITRDTRRDDY